MNVFFSGDIVVVAQGSIVVQAFPISGGSLPEDIVGEVKQIEGESVELQELGIEGEDWGE